MLSRSLRWRATSDCMAGSSSYAACLGQSLPQSGRSPSSSSSANPPSFLNARSGIAALVANRFVKPGGLCIAGALHRLDQGWRP